MTKKNSVLRKAVLPTVLLVGLGGSALVATPAFADEPVSVPTDAASQTSAADPDAGTGPTATAVPTATPTPAAEPTAAPTPTATTAIPTTAPAATAPSAAPKSSAVQPTDLTITSPVFDEDQDPIVITGPRTVTITGTAPTGSAITITNGDDDTLARFTTTSTSFTTTLSFADDVSYEQSIFIDATFRGNDLSEGYVVVDFDAETSETPTLDAPVAGVDYETAPLPLGLGTLGKPITLTGTGTAGDDITLYFDKRGDTPGTEAQSQRDGNATDFFDILGLGTQSGEIVVGKDGTWSGRAYLGYGDVTVTATDQKIDQAAFEPITKESGYSDGVDLSMRVPAGTVLPPSITTPHYDFSDEFSASSTDESDGVTTGGGETDPAAPAVLAKLAVPAAAAAAMKSEASPTKTDPVAAAHTHVEALAAGDADSSGSSADDGSGFSSGDTTSDDPETPAQLDEEAVSDGIQIKGTPSTTEHGKLNITVSGTGTPGDGIVLQSSLPSVGEAYYEALYPKLFAGLASADDDDSDFFGSIPSDPGTVSSLLPVDDHTITVKADGTWTTSYATVPGPAFLTAFSTSPAGAFSVASGLLMINVTGTPIVDPAGTAPTELAFTGSDNGPLGFFGLLALGLGGALTFVSRRRRSRDL